MKYYSISPVQKIDLATSVFLFLILFGFARTALLDQPLDSKNIVFLTLLFAFWFFLVRIFTNATMFPFIYEKLNPYPASTTTVSENV